MKQLIVFTVLAVLLIPNPAGAEPSRACQAVGVAVGAAVGYPAGGQFHPWAGAVTAAVGAFLGHETLSEPCQQTWDSFEQFMTDWGNSMAPNDHDEFYEWFVDNYCNGDPQACAPASIDCGPFSVDCNNPNPFQDQPWNCNDYFECSYPILAVTKPQGYSANDFIDGSLFVSLSYSTGTWEFQNHGHLIGINYNEPPPGENDPY